MDWSKHLILCLCAWWRQEIIGKFPFRFCINIRTSVCKFVHMHAYVFILAGNGKNFACTTLI